jgi:hypothetical protein
MDAEWQVTFEPSSKVLTALKFLNIVLITSQQIRACEPSLVIGRTLTLSQRDASFDHTKTLDKYFV